MTDSPRTPEELEALKDEYRKMTDDQIRDTYREMTIELFGATLDLIEQIHINFPERTVDEAWGILKTEIDAHPLPSNPEAEADAKTMFYEAWTVVVGT